MPGRLVSFVLRTVSVKVSDEPIIRVDTHVIPNGLDSTEGNEGQKYMDDWPEVRSIGPRDFSRFSSVGNLKALSY